MAAIGNRGEDILEGWLGFGNLADAHGNIQRTSHRNRICRSNHPKDLT